jgi:hypothetical protein
MRLPPDVDKAGLMAGSEIAEEIHEAFGRRIRALKGAAESAAAVRPISIALAHTAPRGGVFEPEELDILQRVFDQVCRERKYNRESEEAEAIAATMIVLFQTGVLTEHELLTAIDRGEDLPNGVRAL